MTLTTRLSVFFLTMLGLVLAGFSITLYLLARSHLHRQIQDRLEAGLNTLVAAVEDPEVLALSHDGLPDVGAALVWGDDGTTTLMPDAKAFFLSKEFLKTPVVNVVFKQA